MVKMLDDHVGLIMAELKAQGIDEKTLVVFTSDNGHELYYGPKPQYKKQLRASGEKANLTDSKWRGLEDGDVFDGAGGRAGLKRSGYQGGMQCPLIARDGWKVVQTGRKKGEVQLYNVLKDNEERENLGAPPVTRIPTRSGRTSFKFAVAPDQ